MINNKKKNFKLLYISSDKFPPTRVDVAVLFGKMIAGRGHQIHYLLQSDLENHHFFETTFSGSKVFVGATNNGSKFLSRLLKHILSLINDLRSIPLVIKGRYDFIQVKDKFIAALIAIFLSKISKSKFFYWLSFPFPEADLFEYHTGTARYPSLYYIRGIFFKFLLYNIILPYCDHVFVQSDQMKEDITAQGIPSDKATVVPMGVDFDDIAVATIADSSHVVRDHCALVYLGTMQKVRRIDFVIKVFRKVLDKIPAAMLYMVGDSENIDDLEYLKGLSKKLNIDRRVLFTGKLPRPSALEFVKRSSVGISPFFPTPILNSTSPTKLIEYMAMGIPVVANDHPEQRKVIEESNAGYCVPYHEGAFAEAIISILTNIENSILMGMNGRRYILKKRNYRVIADALENKYYNLLAY